MPWNLHRPLLLLAMSAAAAAAFAQEERERVRDLFISNREFTQRLDKARELLELGETTAALDLVQSVVEAPEDFFAGGKTRASSRVVTNKSQALDLLASLTPAGRRAYELRFGGKARGLLNAATDARGLIDVGRRYFHTAAGREAAFRLGTWYLDRGKPLSAAIQFERLRRLPFSLRKRLEPQLTLTAAVCWLKAGDAPQAQAALVDLKRSADSVRVAGRRVPLFADPTNALQWLTALVRTGSDAADAGLLNWRMVGGGPDRNAHAADCGPVWNSRWTIPTIRDDDDAFHAGEHARAADTVDELVKEHRQSGLLTISPAEPLIVGNQIVYRTFKSVRAVDLRTGQLKWISASRDQKYLDLIEENGSSSQVEQYLRQRAFRDETAGTLSSDGRYVFAVEDLDFVDTSPVSFSTRRAKPQVQSYNRLSGYKIDGGYSGYWKIYLGENERPVQLLLAGSFFLGPPLPVSGRLYCLLEVRGEIRLVELSIDHADESRPAVKVEWQQVLVQPEYGVDLYPLRRLSALSPSYSQGVLVCPTTAGGVVAVDVERRLLLWGYRYRQRPTTGNVNRNALARFRGYVTTPDDPEDRWLGSPVVIAGGKVLLCPRDSNELHCVRLVDGKLLWRRPRGQGLYVAAAFGGNAIVVGRSLLEAFDLNTGELAYEPVPIPMPTGRGFRSGPLYHVPLSTGEIAAIDLTNGRLRSRIKLASGKPPGNLVSAGGRIISQDLQTLTAYQPSTAAVKALAKQLAARPDDPQALLLRGQASLYRGNVAGLTDIRKAQQLKPTSGSGEVLFESLLESLRVEFAASRNSVAELQKLAATSAHKARLLRVEAAGLRRSGESVAAFDRYLRLAALSDEKRLESIGGVREIRSQRLVQRQIAELYAQATPQQRQQIDVRIRRELDAILSEFNPARLESFVELYADLPIAAQARRELAGRLDPKSASTQMLSLLHRSAASADRAASAEAHLRLAQTYLVLNNPRAATDVVQRIADDFAEERIAGKTGRQWADELANHPSVKTFVQRQTPWAPQSFDASRTTTTTSSAGRIYPMDFVGPRGRFYGWTFGMNSTRRGVVGRDAFGITRWTVDVPNSSASPSSYNTYGNSIRAVGDILIVTMGMRFAAIDAASSPPKLLFSRDLWDAIPGQPARRSGVRVVFGVGGARRVIVNDPYNRPLGEVGPVTPELIVHQAGRELYAEATATGRAVWVRKHVARGSRLFGNANRVYVLPRNSSQAMVLRTSDGEYLGVRTVPAYSDWQQVDGEQIVTWDADATTLARYDVWTGATTWSHRFPEGTRTSLIHGSEAAAVDPAGKVTVVDLVSGGVQFAGRVDKPVALSNIVAHRYRDIYVVCTNDPAPDAENRRVTAISYAGTAEPVEGMAYAFDGKGKLLWKTRLERQFMTVGQPSELPILICAARSYDPLSRYSLALTILDVRTGRLAYESTTRESTSSYFVAVDPNKQWVEVGATRTRVRLSVSKRPLTPLGSDAER